MQASEQLLAQIEQLFRSEYPDLVLKQATIENHALDGADWVLIPANHQVNDWENVPASAKILSLLLPDEFSAINQGKPIPRSIEQRWYWIPPVLSRGAHSETVPCSTPEYAVRNNSAHSPIFQLFTEAGGLKPSDAGLDQEEIVAEHLTYLDAQDRGALILSNSTRLGSPLRYMATGCHYANFSVHAVTGLKSAHSLVKLERQQFEEDFHAAESSHILDTLSKQIESIVKESNCDSGSSQPASSNWHLVSFPRHRNTGIDTALIEAHNLQKTIERPISEDALRASPFINWLNQGENSLHFLHYLSLRTRLGAPPSNITRNLALWMLARPSSHAWKLNLRTLETLIPGFHNLYLNTISNTPTDLLNLIRPVQESGPSKSRVAAVIWELEKAQSTPPSETVLSFCEALHNQEASSKNPNWTALSEVIQIWIQRYGESECENRIERLYKSCPTYKNLWATMVRTLAAKMELATAIRLLKREVSSDQSTNFGLTSVMSWWFDAGRTNDALEIAEAVYSEAPSYRGLVSFLAKKQLETYQWEIYSRDSSTSITAAIAQASELLSKESRRDSLAKLLSTRIALYKDEPSNALKIALDGDNSPKEASALAQEFWLFGQKESMRKVLGDSPHTPLNNRPEERLTSALINLSLGRSEKSEHELNSIYKDHFSITLPQAPLHPLNQYLQLHALETISRPDSTKSDWISLSKQRDPKHEMALKTYERNVFATLTERNIKNPFSLSN